MMATCHPSGFPDVVSGKSPDSSRRNTVWNFTSSVFMTVGVADTLCHPQFCRVPILCRCSEFLRKTRLYFEKLLAALLGQRHTCWPWRPARVRTPSRAPHDGGWTPPRGRDGHLPSTRNSREIAGRVHDGRKCWYTWHFQFFRSVIFCSVTALCCSHGTVMFEFVLVNARSFSHLTICTIRVGTDSVLFSLQCTCLVELELEFQIQVFPEGLDSSWHSFTAASLSLRNIAWCSRPWFFDGRISTKNSPIGRPHWSGSFKFKGPQGGLFPEAPPGESQPAKEFAGLSVWQPRVLSLGGLYVVPLAPSLPPSVISFGFFLPRHWMCHVVTTL